MPLSATPHVHALLCQLVKDLKSSTTTSASADAPPPRPADADSSSTPTLVRAFKTQLQPACPTCTSSTPKHATVFARPSNSAFVEQLQSTPLADAQHHQAVLPLRFTTQLPVSADARQLPHAVADSSSVLSLAIASLIRMPDASHLFTFTTPTFVIADAEQLLSALVTPLHSTPLVLVQLSKPAQLLKCSIRPLADADAHPFNSAVVDSSSTPYPAHALLTPTPVACPTSTDSTPPDATASV